MFDSNDPNKDGASMTARELKYTYIEEAMSILDNEEVMKKVLYTIHRCKKAIEGKKIGEKDLIAGSIPTLQFTREQLITELQESEADRKAGCFRQSEDVFRDMEEKFPFLCK